MAPEPFGAESPENVRAAEVSLGSFDLAKDMEFFETRLGFRLDAIFPADRPRVAVMSGHGLRVRLDAQAPLTTGMRIEFADASPPLEIPRPEHAFVVRRLEDGDPWVVGRAGMEYRDLIPGRLGGAIIASHIRIPNPGPVPDLVHYHAVAFQLIFCHRGWVEIVYEDQGPAFVLKAGDCVIQPPHIRHRVLEASENIEVIEVGVPAEHLTTIDHELALPTAVSRPDRLFAGQRFCRSQADDAVWTPWRLPGFEARETGIGAATGGIACVRVARPAGQTAQHKWTSHDADILFAFVLSGSLKLRGEGSAAHVLSEGDAYVIPPNMKTVIETPSADLQLLEVSLPAGFNTRVHQD